MLSFLTFPAFKYSLRTQILPQLGLLEKTDMSSIPQTLTPAQQVWYKQHKVTLTHKKFPFSQNTFTVTQAQPRAGFPALDFPAWVFQVRKAAAGLKSHPTSTLGVKVIVWMVLKCWF